jgi:tellurite methyltransferase
MNRTLEFFGAQFARQIDARDYALNPFEQRVLPLLQGDVLDLGCGLGCLALAAAAQGARVEAIDGSANAIADLQARSVRAGLSVSTAQADLRTWMPGRRYDCVVSIGLLMFFPCPTAELLLARIQQSVLPGGLCAVNVLIEGTTFQDMFEPGQFCLMAPGHLVRGFAGWQVLGQWQDDFPATHGTIKRFETVLARRPR